MSIWLELLILFIVGNIAGFINIMAGGGSTITMPLLILLGMDASMANGTNRLAILIQNISGILSFHQDKKYDFKKIVMLAMWTLPGALIGVITAVRIQDELFEKILGIVIIAVVITLMLPKPKQTSPAKHKWLAYPTLFAIGFYGGFIQAGVGFLLIATFSYILGLDLVQANMNKIFIIFLYIIPTVVIFAVTKNIHYPFALALAAGTASGAWWSAKLALKGGEKIIRIVLFVAVVIMAVKLIR